MKLRYYADAEVRSWHEHTLRLLDEIHDQHDVMVEVDRIESRHGSLPDFPDSIRQTTAQEVYERDLKRNRTLSDAIDQRPSEAFKRYGDFDIAGNIAIVDTDDGVQWASVLPGYAEGYGPNAGPHASLDVLETMAVAPTNHLCTECYTLLSGSEDFCPACGTDLT